VGSSCARVRSRACVGAFQLTPAPKKNPFGAWNVTPSVARVSFSIFEATGGRRPSTPTSVAVVSVAVVPDGTSPFSSVKMRTGRCEGNAAPAPHRNAPVGTSKPSDEPRYA
jgi:hypothetical protein